MPLVLVHILEGLRRALTSSVFILENSDWPHNDLVLIFDILSLFDPIVQIHFRYVMDTNG